MAMLNNQRVYFKKDNQPYGIGLVGVNGIYTLSTASHAGILVDGRKTCLMNGI